MEAKDRQVYKVRDGFSKFLSPDLYNKPVVVCLLTSGSGVTIVCENLRLSLQQLRLLSMMFNENLSAQEIPFWTSNTIKNMLLTAREQNHTFHRVDLEYPTLTELVARTVGLGLLETATLLNIAERCVPTPSFSLPSLN